MMYVGMDLHKNYLQVAVMDEKGKVIRNSKIDNDIQKIGRFFDQIKNKKKNDGVIQKRATKRIILQTE